MPGGWRPGVGGVSSSNALRFQAIRNRWKWDLSSGKRLTIGTPEIRLKALRLWEGAQLTRERARITSLRQFLLLNAINQIETPFDGKKCTSAQRFGGPWNCLAVKNPAIRQFGFAIQQGICNQPPVELR